MREKLRENKLIIIITKILKFISWMVLIFLLIIAGFLIFYVMMAKKAEKRGENYKPAIALYTIISPSMVPNINVYDVVFNVKVNDLNKLKEGDVITFVSSDSYRRGMIITHRIQKKYVTGEGVQFKTKGDANAEADSALVFEENVIGKVLFRIPQLGRVQFFLSKKSGWFIAILIPALIVISYDIFKLIKLLLLRKKLKKQSDVISEPIPIIEEDGEKILDLSSTENKPVNNEVKTSTEASPLVTEENESEVLKALEEAINATNSVGSAGSVEKADKADKAEEKTPEEENEELLNALEEYIKNENNNTKS